MKTQEGTNGTHPTEKEVQFEVVARAYAHMKSFGDKPDGNLLGIGRNMGLSDQKILSIQFRTRREIQRRGKPRSIEDKGWVWPTPSEERARAVA